VREISSRGLLSRAGGGDLPFSRVVVRIRAAEIRARARDFYHRSGTSLSLEALVSSAVSKRRALCYVAGINRRNKLSRWIEVLGKIEFADSEFSNGDRIPEKSRRRATPALDKSPQSRDSSYDPPCPRLLPSLSPSSSLFPLLLSQKSP